MACRRDGGAVRASRATISWSAATQPPVSRWQSGCQLACSGTEPKCEQALYLLDGESEFGAPTSSTSPPETPSSPISGIRCAPNRTLSWGGACRQSARRKVTASPASVSWSSSSMTSRTGREAASSCSHSAAASVCEAERVGRTDRATALSSVSRADGVERGAEAVRQRPDVPIARRQGDEVSAADIRQRAQCGRLAVATAGNDQRHAARPRAREQAFDPGPPDERKRRGTAAEDRRRDAFGARALFTANVEIPPHDHAQSAVIHRVGGAIASPLELSP